MPGKGWRRIESTPPFSDLRPGSYESGEGMKNRNQESNGLPAEAVKTEDGKGKPLQRVGLFLSIPPLFLLIIGFPVYLSKTGLVRTLRKSFRYYRRSGVTSPEKNGWTAWVEEISLQSSLIRENSLSG